eukprot:augustus_masked-scaffold_27-processed-gene-3.25-mRNA-1 protein AED:1.00 eAED:1.00 QI:0/-1/0/0/-1/1/1/0/1607
MEQHHYKQLDELFPEKHKAALEEARRFLHELTRIGSDEIRVFTSHRQESQASVVSRSVTAVANSLPSVGEGDASHFFEQAQYGKVESLRNNPRFFVDMFGDQEGDEALSEASRESETEQQVYRTSRRGGLDPDELLPKGGRRVSRRYRKDTSTKNTRRVPFTNNWILTNRPLALPQEEENSTPRSSCSSVTTYESIGISKQFKLQKKNVDYIRNQLDSLENDYSDEGTLRLNGILCALTLIIRHRGSSGPLFEVSPTLVRILAKLVEADELTYIYACHVIESMLYCEKLKGNSDSSRASWLELGLEDILSEKMQTFVFSELAQKLSFKVFWHLAEEEKLKVKVMKNTMQNVQAAMNNFKNSSGLQYEACALLQRLAVNDENELLIQSSGALLLVLQTALNKNLDITTVKKACSALWNLSFNDRNRKYLIKQEAHKKIFDIIRQSKGHPHGVEVVAKASGVMWNLADYMEAKTQLILDDIPKKMVQVMAEYRFNPKVQEMGCGCLRSLAHDDASRVKLMEIGAAKKILESMQDHINEKDIQYQAFAVLKKLSCNDVNEGRLIKMQAGQRILEAMEAHKNEASIQERACGVLWNLAVNDQHKKDLVEMGCAQKMLQAMQLHLDNEGVQYQTCRTLKRLARDTNNERTLMRLNAADCVLKAMEKHSTNANIQEKGCGVLWNLSDRDEHKAKLMELGAATRILKAMRQHLGNDNVQYEACGALKRLAVDDNIEGKLMKMGAAQQVIAAMKNHYVSADVQSQACGVLWNLAFNGQVRLMELKAPDQIFEAMKRHPKVTSVQEKACGTLWKLAEIEKNNAELIRQGVIQHVIDAMKNNESHEGVQYQACGTIWNLAVKERNRKDLLDKNVEDCVLKAMENHTNRADIMHSACGVLLNLLQSNVEIKSYFNEKGDRVALKKDPAVLRSKAPGSFTYTKVSVNNRVLLGAKNAVEKIKISIQRHQENVDVVFQALAALNHLSKEPLNLLKLLAPQVLHTVIVGMSLHADDPGVRDSALTLLSNVMLQLVTLNFPSVAKNFFGISKEDINSVQGWANIEVPVPKLLLESGVSKVIHIMKQFVLTQSSQEKGIRFLNCCILFLQRKKQRDVYRLQQALSSYEKKAKHFHDSIDDSFIRSRSTFVSFTSYPGQSEHSAISVEHKIRFQKILKPYLKKVREIFTRVFAAMSNHLGSKRIMEDSLLCLHLFLVTNNFNDSSAALVVEHQKLFLENDALVGLVASLVGNIGSGKHVVHRSLGIISAVVNLLESSVLETAERIQYKTCLAEQLEACDFIKLLSDKLKSSGLAGDEETLSMTLLCLEIMERFLPSLEEYVQHGLLYLLTSFLDSAIADEQVTNGSEFGIKQKCFWKMVTVCKDLMCLEEPPPLNDVQDIILSLLSGARQSVLYFPVIASSCVEFSTILLQRGTIANQTRNPSSFADRVTAAVEAIMSFIFQCHSEKTDRRKEFQSHFSVSVISQAGSQFNRQQLLAGQRHRETNQLSGYDICLLENLVTLVKELCHAKRSSTLAVHSKDNLKGYLVSLAGEETEIQEVASSLALAKLADETVRLVDSLRLEIAKEQRSPLGSMSNSTRRAPGMIKPKKLSTQSEHSGTFHDLT